MEGRLRDTRRQSRAQDQADRVFEGFVVLRTLSPLRQKPSRCVSRVAHVSPLTSHLLSPRRLPLGRPPARDTSSAHDVERSGRDTRGQESPSSRVPARPGRPHLVQRLRLVRTESPHFLASRRCLREKRPHHRLSLRLLTTSSSHLQTTDLLTRPPFSPQNPIGTPSRPRCKP